MKTPYLGKGVIWVLKEFGKVSINEIVEMIGWTRKQVYDEIRRLKDASILGLWITESNSKDDKCYELDLIMRSGASIDCLQQIGKKTFKFNSPIQERL
jgi:hypothetical protein